MATVVSVEEAQIRLCDLLLEVDAGGEVVITVDGEPSVRLVLVSDHDGDPRTEA